MDNKDKLVLLRVQLYGAAQLLKGEEANEFWALLEEVQRIRDATAVVKQPLFETLLEEAGKRWMQDKDYRGDNTGIGEAGQTTLHKLRMAHQDAVAAAKNGD